MEDADVFTREDFTKFVSYGAFNNFDGIGYLACLDAHGEIQETNIKVNCSVRWLNQQPECYTHVCWYNK